MSRSDPLTEFVHAGLAAGRAPQDLQAALARAGWSGREIAEGLDAWLPPGDGLPPVPRPRPHVSARDAVIYGLLFLTLGAICWHIGALGFAIIDALWPEPGDFYAPPRASMRWSVAVLIAAVPLFLWLNARVTRATGDDPGRRRSLVRRWFAAVTLLLAALALMSDLVAVVYAVLNGDLTARFAAKAVLIAVLGGVVFAWWRDELDAG
ncbi:DUF5671 domain-containing protein [Paracoccus luteus]|uniref:DUF5671 domain-containing protein n=1 Tax=Paracoccus luteus TaxID=2508543 RepID=UPI0010705070|nr:DUF5671 domain-containing protein [Paracoccus luteus]